MGNIVTSKCHLCGFTNKFKLGGGKYSYQTHCPVPAINIETLDFENINHYDHKDSDKYLFYSDADLKGENTEDKAFRNFNLIFNEEVNYCPSCKNKSLAFRVVMYFD